MSTEALTTANTDGAIPLFEQIRRVDDAGFEYWSARELAKVLDYREYRNFKPALERAMEACQNSGFEVSDHFVDMHDMVKLGSGAERQVEDVKLSRYACYLIVQNADPGKEVVDPMDYAIFQNFGYKGLYGGLDAQGIKRVKGLNKTANILDHMGSTELAANLFRATQTEEKIKREQIQGKANANQAHYEVGKKVRKTIQELGGTMPENLPAAESIKKIEQKVKKLNQGD